MRKENSIGWSIVLFSSIGTLVVWLTTLKSYEFIWKDPFLFLSKTCVLPGTILFCWSFFLSTRLKIIEKAFGGIDKAYHAHKLVSETSFLLILLHPAFQFFRFLPNYRKSLELFIPRALTALEFGIAALIIFILLISLTLWIKIPYHIWKKTHEFFILVLLLGLIHIWLIDKQVHDSYGLMLWIYSYICLALFSYIYTRFLYRFLGPKFNYIVSQVKKKQECWDVYLEPVDKKKMEYKPAQFVFISFRDKQIGNESHPFSVSSAPHQTLRLSIKGLGDYTSRLDVLKPGVHARLWGPYGLFYEKYFGQPEKSAVMIANGIGITPFLSLLHHETRHPLQRDSKLFYSVKDRTKTDYIDELKSLASINTHIGLFISYYDEQKLGMALVQDYLDKNVKDYNFFLCGSLKMMKTFEKELKKLGVKNSQIIFEDFNLFD